LAWVQQRVNALMNNREKELLKVSIHRQKRVHFLGKEVSQKMCEKSLQNKCSKGMLFNVNDMPIVYVKGGIMVHSCRAIC
jgi:hypothetical protein